MAAGFLQQLIVISGVTLTTPIENEILRIVLFAHDRGKLIVEYALGPELVLSFFPIQCLLETVNNMALLIDDTLDPASVLFLFIFDASWG